MCIFNSNKNVLLCTVVLIILKVTSNSTGLQLFFTTNSIMKHLQQVNYYFNKCDKAHQMSVKGSDFLQHICMYGLNRAESASQRS